MVQRAFLGSLEAVVNAGFMLVTAAWYKKYVLAQRIMNLRRILIVGFNSRYEHASRVGIWSACVGLSNVIGGAIGVSPICALPE